LVVPDSFFEGIVRLGNRTVGGLMVLLFSRIGVVGWWGRALAANATLFGLCFFEYTSLVEPENIHGWEVHTKIASSD
jgi:hypothetical protein